MDNPLLANIKLNPTLQHLRLDPLPTSHGNNKAVLVNGLAHTMVDKKDLVMRKLTDFYEVEENLQRMLDVVEGRSQISLRLLDWLITNYAKKNDIIYCIEKNGIQRQFMVYSNYRAQLKAYSKNLFDPFCRHVC